ncbi:putative lipoprotein [Parvimonas sp. oral taxon 393 str. F0440]|nr:putative lipoprotein [Parvimonas sp. oral taxon 393 str. F0440]
MAKLKKLVSLLLVSLMLCSCASSSMLKNIENRVYDGEKGAQLVVMKENFKSPKLRFQGPSPITPNTNPEDIEKNRDKYEKSITKEYSGVKIEERDGKKYIVAKDLKYKLVVIDENTILDEEDNVTYRRLPDLYKKDKK